MLKQEEETFCSLINFKGRNEETRRENRKEIM
jgi:hypothetical protein